MKNIIFDLGGVIINIDYNRTIEAFKKLGVLEFDKFYSQARQTLLFDEFETGKISAKEFRRKLKKFIPKKITGKQVDDAWKAMLLDIPCERIELLDKLSKNYRLFLLSNTNEIHIPEVNRILKKNNLLHTWNRVFEKKYYSHEIKMRKPDREIFEYVLTQNNLKAEETLFIDDSIQHIEGAKMLGINTFFLEKGKTILDIFPAEV